MIEHYSLPGVRRGFVLGVACTAVVAGAAFMAHGRRPAAPSDTAPAIAGIAATVDRHHAATAGDLATAVRVSARLLPGARPVAAAPVASPQGADVPALLARADRHRREREFSQACALYAEVVVRGGMTADAWADYADAQASVTGSLAGAPARAVEAALALDPRHAKALWLQASLAHEEHRYDDALATWRRLLAVVPAGSNDARIIEANISEATRLAAG